VTMLHTGKPECSHPTVFSVKWLKIVDSFLPFRVIFPFLRTWTNSTFFPTDVTDFIKRAYRSFSLSRCLLALQRTVTHRPVPSPPLRADKRLSLLLRNLPVRPLPLADLVAPIFCAPCCPLVFYGTARSPTLDPCRPI